MGKAERITTPGLNVRWPWSELIVSGRKTVETRSYPLPLHLINQVVAIIQTGTPSGEPASIVGLVRFISSFKYESKKHWLEDRTRHQVEASNSDFAYVVGVDKWGWEIDFACRVEPAAAPPQKKGIKFAKACLIPIDSVQYPKAKLRQIMRLSASKPEALSDIGL